MRRRRYEVTEMYALIEIAIWSSRAIISGSTFTFTLGLSIIRFTYAHHPAA